VVGQNTILTVATPPLTVAATQDEIDEAVLEDRRRTDRWVNHGEHNAAVTLG
jgi:hypothetical protein